MKKIIKTKTHWCFFLSFDRISKPFWNNCGNWDRCGKKVRWMTRSVWRCTIRPVWRAWIRNVRTRCDLSPSHNGTDKKNNKKKLQLILRRNGWYNNRRCYLLDWNIVISVIHTNWLFQTILSATQLFLTFLKETTNFRLVIDPKKYKTKKNKMTKKKCYWKKNNNLLAQQFNHLNWVLFKYLKKKFVVVRI